MIVESRAPTRIDLAGGTLDIFPLYLFEGYGITLNISINLYATAKIQERQDSCIKIVSRDLNTTEEFPINELTRIARTGPLALIKNVLLNMKVTNGLEIETSSLAPERSGLGNSSSLAIAISGGIAKLMQSKFSRKKLVDLAFNTELQIIRVPTGRQDYYGAVYGGVKAIWLKPDGDSIERLKLSKKFLSELEKHLVLVYVGRSHSSPKVNWQIFKNYVDKRPSTVESLRSIKEIALKMRDALIQEDLEKVAFLLNLEWSKRRKLAPDVETSRMRDIREVCLKSGASAFKACGAGGNGCAIVLSHDRNIRRIQEEVVRKGGSTLDYRIVHRGLNVRMVEAAALEVS